MEAQNTSASRFENYIFIVAVALLPLFVLPIFPNAFVTPKLALLGLAIGLILIIKSVRSIVTNSFSFSASSFDLPVILLGVAYLVSSIIQTPNKMEAYFLPGEATVMVFGVIGFFLVNQLRAKEKELLKYAIVASGAFAAIFALLASSGILKSMGVPPFMQSTAFTTLGGPLPALILFLALLPIALSYVINEDNIGKKTFFGIAFALLILGSIISVVNILPGKESAIRLPGFSTSWSVAIDSLKQSPLLGVGPGNYLTAFNRFRPVSYNQTDLWATRFTSAQNFLFTSITETGLIGTAAIIIMAYLLMTHLLKHGRKGVKNFLGLEGSAYLSILIVAVSFLLIPSSPVIMILFFVLLAIVAHNTVVKLGLFNSTSSERNIPFAARLPVIIASLPVVVVVIFLGFQASRVLAADITYRNALNYIVQNNGTAAYDTLLKAINTNPYVDRYRVTYAQINLALANSIAQKEEVTDEDRNTIAQLIQQAIREGKAAVTLNPTRSGNWEVLASIYRTVMPLAQGADAFAVQTYTQAIALDPINTNSRIALGGIYYSAKAYEDAIDVFKLAVATKPDHANAHYNLAVAYQQAGNLDRAIAEMSQVLSLVDKSSDDFTVATKALEDLQNKKKAQTPEGSTNLTPPTEGAETLNPPIELPADAQPPQPEVTPSPEPSAIPEASPTPTPEP
jgi:tetratricopeptide (TPR) repeat protein